MQQDRTAVRWLEPIVALLTLILLLATPLLVYVRPSFAELQYRRAGFPPADRFGDAERLRLSRPLIDYLRHRASYADMAALRTDAGKAALTPAELSHMADVRRVMDSFYWAEGVAVVALLALALWLWRARRAITLTRGLRRGVLLTVGLMAVILIAVAIDFDRFFMVFHSLFFTNGTWVFSYRDTLIQLYPLPFWVTAVTAYVVTILLLAALLWGLATRVDRRARR
ncbi:MAG: TIGR01906 family membrane protein [Anaerolineae bacterium]